MAALLRNTFKSLVRLSTLGMETGATVDRFFMYERVKDALASTGEPAKNARILSVSYSTYLASLVQSDHAEVVEANYPEYDIFNLAFEDDTFDFVVADQVLEHLRGDPQRAIDETRRVLRPGGIAIHTTCLLNEIHDPAGDYWRFTPDGLALLCSGFSNLIQCEGWGNKLAFFGFRYYPVPLKTWHPLYKIATRQDPEALITTWFVARK